MERLSGLDAAFLAFETPSAHMQVMAVAVLDPATVPDPAQREPAAFFERVHTLLESRLHLVPPLRHRLVEVPFGLHVPMWIEDPDFDLSFHLRRAALPRPGGPQELAGFVADVASRPLDRSHPLWESYVVEGLEHGYVAYVAKLHHSLIDGAAGVEILTALFDLAPDAPLESVEPEGEEWTPDRVPSDLEMLGRATAAIGQRPLHFMQAAANLVPGLWRAVRRARADSLDVALPLTAPRLSMNRTISARRVVAFSSVSLAEVKSVRRALGLTVNDVVLAIATGALRTYLERRGELPDKPLIASVPTSVRVENDQGFGNRVSSMFAALPVEITDPVERAKSVARFMSGAKQVHEDVGGSTLHDWAQTAAPIVFSRAMKMYTNLHVGERFRPVINLVISNVPGPPFPLYFAGARLMAIHPLGPIFDDCGLNLTVMSYEDHIDFGFIACRELVRDVGALAAAIPDALTELVKASVG